MLYRSWQPRLSVVTLLLATAFATTACAADRLPNFVIIYIDDMGYGDIGPFGAEGYQTPNLDRMAQEGRRFTDFYVTQAVCSASRAGLLTGCYNVRVGILGALNHRASHGIGSEEMTTVIMAGTLTTLVVFLPILFVNVQTRLLYGGVGSTVTFSLVASLFVALTVVPLLSSRSELITASPKWIDTVGRYYRRWLIIALRNRRRLYGNISKFLLR